MAPRKTKREPKRHINVFRYKFSDGVELELPIDEGLADAARQLYAIAATQTDDAERARLREKAAWYEQVSRSLTAHRTIAEHDLSRRSAGGKATAEQRRSEKERNVVTLQAAANKIWADDSSLKIDYVAGVLADHKIAGYTSARVIGSLIQRPPKPQRSRPGNLSRKRR